MDYAAEDVYIVCAIVRRLKMGRRGEGIYHRKDGLWEARYVKGLDSAGKKKYGSVYGHSYREAKEKRLDILSQISILPQSVSARRLLLNELIAEWLYVNQSRIKPATYQKYRLIYEKHIKNSIGTHPVIYLTPVMLKRYADEKLDEGLSEVTINGMLTFIRTCLKYGSRQYGTPVTDVIYLKPPRKEMRVFSPDEQNRLVHLLLTDIDIYKLGVLIALFTGVRIGELCALTWGDVKDGTISINKSMQRLSKGKGLPTEVVIGEPKTATSNRIIPIPSFLLPYIEEARRADRCRVISLRGRELIEPRIMQNHFQQYLKELNIPHATFHTLRHTFATRCTEAGCEIKSLSELLGHSSVTITLSRYVHSSLALKAANMEKLSLFL